MNLPNCYICGKFVGYKKDHVTWTNYGGYNDTEPPDETYAHLNCYDNYEFKQTLNNYTWQPPLIVKGTNNGTGK